MAENGPAGDSSEAAGGDRDGGEDRCSCKLGRSRRAYEVRGLDRTLRRRHDDGASLRALERVVNVAILERALDRARADVVGDVGSIYETLDGESGSAGDRAELRGRLERAGVDVDALEAAFVSYQTVRTHLRDCLDEDTGRESSLSRDDAVGTVEWARSRSEGIVERTLERLAGDGELAAGDLDVTQVIRVTCRDCGASAAVGEFLDGGGCDCGAEDDGP